MRPFEVPNLTLPEVGKKERLPAILQPCLDHCYQYWNSTRTIPVSNQGVHMDESTRKKTFAAATVLFTFAVIFCLIEGNSQWQGSLTVLAAAYSAFSWGRSSERSVSPRD
jgi:hypothetical protein